MKTNYLLAFVLIWGLILIVKSVNSQGVAVNTDGTNAHASAMLDVKSSSSGILIPRMTQAQRNAISSPATSLLIFQTDNTPGYYYWDGSTWVQLFTGDEIDPTWDGDANTTSDVGRTGKVGIGTTSPIGKLHVEHIGTIGTTAYNMNNAWLRVGALGFDPNEITTDGDLYITAQNFVRIGSGTANAILSVTSTESVGIGTTAPTAQFHTTGTVRFANYVNGFLQVDASGNLSTGTGSDLFTAGDGLVWSGTTLNSLWKENGSDIYNGNAGNVGVGTLTPSYLLDVNGEAWFEGSVHQNLNGARIVFESDLSDRDAMYWNQNGTTVWKNFIMSDGDIKYEDVQGGNDFYILAGNNVGIGTTTPANKLHVSSAGWDNQLLVERTDGNASITLKDNVAETAQISMVSGNLGLRGEGTDVTNTFIIEKNTGNVGIGVADPLTDLHVSGGTGSVNLLVEADTDNNTETDNPTIELSQDGDIVHGYIGLNSDTDGKFSGAISNGMYLQTDPARSDALQLATGGNARLTVAGNGNVGIGSTTPASTLAVGDAGNSDHKVSIYDKTADANTIALNVKADPSALGGDHVYGIYSSVNSGSSWSYGICGVSNGGSGSGGRAYGVRGIAGGGTSGYNYAVRGELVNDGNNGVAIAGVDNAAGSLNDAGGRWAGYFVGDVNIDGDLTVTGNMQGDNLGNHTATQNLDMTGYDIKFSSGDYIEIASDHNIQLDDANPTWYGDSYGGVIRFHGDESVAKAKLEGGGMYLANDLEVETIHAGEIDDILYVDGIHFTSIQDAIDALPAAGGKVIIPAGTYSISSQIDLSNKSNVTIEGVGKASVITPTSAMYVINLYQADNIIIKNLNIDCNDNTSSGMRCINLQGASNCIISECWFYDAYYAAYFNDNGSSYPCEKNLFSSNVIYNCRYGIYSYADYAASASASINNSNRIVNNVIDLNNVSSSRAIDLNSYCAAYVVSGNTIQNTGSHGIDVSYSYGMIITSNTVMNAGGNGIHFQGGEGLVITSNTIQNTTSEGVRGLITSNITCSNNTAVDCGSYGFYMYSGTSGTAVGNTSNNADSFGSGFVSGYNQ